MPGEVSVEGQVAADDQSSIAGGRPEDTVAVHNHDLRAGCGSHIAEGYRPWISGIVRGRRIGRDVGHDGFQTGRSYQFLSKRARHIVDAWRSPGPGVVRAPIWWSLNSGGYGDVPCVVDD